MHLKKARIYAVFVRRESILRFFVAFINNLHLIYLVTYGKIYVQDKRALQKYYTNFEVKKQNTVIRNNR